LLLAACVAHAQTYPTKPVRMLVGQPPGGPTDIAARVYGDKLRALLNQPVIVDNRPGAQTQIAILMTAKAEPDGYTLLYAGPGLVTLPSMSKSYTADSIRDFTPISLLVTIPLAIASSAQLPVKTFDEFIADLRANPGKRNYANSGLPDYMHMMVFKRITGTDFVTVRFNGQEPAFQSMFSGDTQFTYTTVGALKPVADSGKVRILAVMGDKRSSLVPDIPALVECGDAQLRPKLAQLASYLPVSWFGLVGPANLPAAAVDVLSAATTKVGRDADYKKRMDALALETVGSTPAEFAQRIRDDVDNWRKITQETNYVPQ
jgi:tripartite-type tricarboxylate transporter receptor subunit TctC